MPETRLTLLVLRSPRLDTILAFYSALGIAFVEERHGEGPLHFAGRIGDTTLELYPLPADGVADTTTRLGFKVADLPAVLRSMDALGVAAGAPRETPWGLRAVVRDPDGRAVELYHAP